MISSPPRNPCHCNRTSCGLGEAPSDDQREERCGIPLSYEVVIPAQPPALPRTAGPRIANLLEQFPQIGQLSDGICFAKRGCVRQPTVVQDALFVTLGRVPRCVFRRGRCSLGPRLRRSHRGNHGLCPGTGDADDGLPSQAVQRQYHPGFPGLWSCRECWLRSHKGAPPIQQGR